MGVKINKNVLESYVPLYNWHSYSETFEAQLEEFKTWVINECSEDLSMVNCGFNGAHYVAIVEKASTQYLSFILFNYHQSAIYILENGSWIDPIVLKDNYVATKYLGQNPDINSMRWESGVYGLYGCNQAPASGIGILEVLAYSGDWVIQRYTKVGATPQMWERAFHSGTTWGAWIQRW